MSQTIKIAVTPWSLSQAGLARDLCEQASLAEKMGFHSFWLPENHFGDDRSIPSPLTLLAAVAATTSTLKLGTTSYLITVRNPLQAAEEVAVLDRLSGGRLILGLGRGVQNAMFTAFELPTKEKRKRFKENLDIMQNAWRGGVIVTEEDGKTVHLAPLPVQQPHPPLWVAAFGPLALKQAGKLAMPYLASPVETLQTLEKNYDIYNEVVRSTNQPPVTTVPIMRTVFVTNSQSKARAIKQALDASAPHSMREEDANIDDWTIIGDKAYVKDKLAEYVERLGMTHVIARGRLPDVTSEEQIASHESLVNLA